MTPRLTPQALEESVALSDLRESLNRALTDLDNEKRRTAKLVDAVYRAAHDAASSLEWAPLTAPIHDPRDGAAEVAVMVMGDWQLGKRTPTYNSETCERRIHEYAAIAKRITEDHRSHAPVRECRIYCLGDMIEGELIFPGQAHRIDASAFRQICVNGPRILLGLVRDALSIFEKVHVVWVKGNHGDLGGRGRKEMHPESNGDAMLYEIVRARLEEAGESRVTTSATYIENEALWYAVDPIGDHAFFLWHGYQNQGGSALGYPWYGFGKKIGGYATGAVPEWFDYSIAGHYHTPSRFNVGRITHWGNGSTESNNTYAQEALAAMGHPSQWLFFVHPSLGVVAEHEVKLT